MSQELEKRVNQILTASVLSYFLFALFSISLAQISGLIGLIALIISFQLNNSWRQVRLPLIKPFLLFTLAAVISIVFAESFRVSLNQGKRLLEPLIFYWLINSIPQMNISLGAFLDFLTRCFSFGKPTQFLEDPSPGGHSTATCMHLLTVTGAAVALWGFYQSMTSGYWATPISTLNNSMTLSMVLMVLSLVAIARAFEKPSGSIRVLFLIIAGTMIVVLLMASRREAWLGFLIGLVYLIWCYRKKWLWALPIILALVYFFSPLHIQERMSLEYALNDASVMYRLQLWQASLGIIAEHPFLGCGFGCMDVTYTRYPEYLELFQKFRYFHNSFIQIAVDTGLLGLSAWLILWGAYIHLLGKRSQGLNKNPLYNWSEKSAFAALIAFLFASFFETHFYDQEVMMVLYPILAFPFATRPLHNASQRGQGRT